MDVRITIRGEGNELRGTMRFDTMDDVKDFAKTMTPYGVVIVSPVAPDPEPSAWDTHPLDEAPEWDLLKDKETSDE